MVYFKYSGIIIKVTYYCTKYYFLKF